VLTKQRSIQELEVKLHTYITMQLYGVEWSASDSEERGPGCYWIGGWVGYWYWNIC